LEVVNKLIARADRPLSDKGKPVVRRGRKAADQENLLIARLPKEGSTF
jgi:hypothetical protein